MPAVGVQNLKRLCSGGLPACLAWDGMQSKAQPVKPRGQQESSKLVLSSLTWHHLSCTRITVLIAGQMTLSQGEVDAGTRSGLRFWLATKKSLWVIMSIVIPVVTRKSDLGSLGSEAVGS